MKKWITNAIIFIAGTAIGGISTFVACKFNEEKRIEAEVKSVRDAFSKANSSGSDEDSNNNDKDITNDDNQRQMALKCVSGASERLTSTEMREGQSVVSNIAFSEGYDVDEDGALDPYSQKAMLINDVINSASPDERDTMPFVMTDKMLEDDPAASDMTFMTLYLGDQSLVDDQTESAVSISDTIGEDIYNKFLNAHETDEIFVKDPRTDIVYDIVKEHGSYKEIMEAYHGGV